MSPSVERPDFDEPRDRDGFRAQRARVGRQAGAEKLGASVWDLPPSQAVCPYHWHAGEEELLVVLSGRPSLRTPAGWRELEQGEVVAFPAGEDGAHQLANRGAEDVRLLIVSTQQPDFVVYEDSGKIGVYERRPEGGGLRELFRRADAVDYWEGEEPPAS
jgi:uncharacterized cupin superfamily protein